MIKQLKELFSKIAAGPSFWTDNHKVDYVWSDKLDKLLDSNATLTVCSDGYTAFLETENEIVEVWIKNWPYSYGYKVSRPSRSPLIVKPCLPTVAVRKKLFKKVAQSCKTTNIGS